MQADGAHAEHIIPITESRALVVDLANPRSRHWHDPARSRACIRCGETKPLAEFYSYGYTTTQGKASTRYESRCRPCARERRKERSAANPGMDAAISRQRRTAKPEWYAGYQASYQASEHGRRVKARNQRIRGARQRAGMAGREDRAAVRAIYAEAAALERVIAACPVFDLPELGKRLHVDHIVALSKGGPHVASNLQILPVGLNLRKGAR